MQFDNHCLLGLASDTLLVDLRRRQRMLIQELCAIRDGKPVTTVSPFAVLVKKLQESLTRMESFEVISVAHSADGKRSSLAMTSPWSLTDACRLQAQLTIPPRSPITPSFGGSGRFRHSP